MTLGTRPSLLLHRADCAASTALAVVSAIHLALFVALFWILLGNGIIATQIVE
jgi:hypothetical protein